MFRTFSLAIAAIGMLVAAYAPAQEIIDPKLAAEDPDFKIQGEYLGKGKWPGEGESQVGAQVIARGDGKFRAVVYAGGLPGDGWSRDEPHFSMEGETKDGVTTLTGENNTATIEDGKLTITDATGKQMVELEPTERKSPTEGAEAPKQAVVLFDGKNADQFPGGTISELGTLEAGCNSKKKYRVKKLHLEFRLSYKPTASGQGRSNSGVYIGGIPEIQVLDSFGLEGKKNECGAFYGRRQPDVNMCYPPLTWQTYDVQFTTPEVDDEGKPKGNVLATVRHNGVVIHENYDTKKKTIPERNLSLQKHGNRVQYRNIWLVEAE